MMESKIMPQIGMRFYKNGIRIDVDFVEDDKVYYRRWPRNVRRQSFFANCFWVSVKKFMSQIQREKPRIVML